MCQSQDRGLFGINRVSMLERRWTVRGIVCRSQNNIGLFVGNRFSGVGRSETRLGFHFEVKFQSLSI